LKVKPHHKDEETHHEYPNEGELKRHHHWSFQVSPIVGWVSDLVGDPGFFYPNLKPLEITITIKELLVLVYFKSLKKPVVCMKEPVKN
jgi:hypothetical protein